MRSSGPGGQNVNKLSTAVQLRFDVRHSPSLPNDVAVRLMRLAGQRMTKDGVLVHHRAEPPHPGAQPRRGAGAAGRADPGGRGAADPAPRHQADQGLEAEAPGGQEAPLRDQAPAAEQAVVRIAGAVRPRALAARRIAPVKFGRASRIQAAHARPPAFRNHWSTASPPARWSSGRRAWSRNWSRTRSTPARRGSRSRPTAAAAG